MDEGTLRIKEQTRPNSSSINNAAASLTQAAGHFFFSLLYFAGAGEVTVILGQSQKKKTEKH